MKRVVLSSDVNIDYSFFCPITSLLWRQRGYRPLLFLVGAVENWHTDLRLKLALERSRELGAEIYFVPETVGVRTSTIAQTVRLFGALTPGVSDDDFLLTSDIDMFPLGPWAGGGRDDLKPLTLWYANAYQFPHPQFPMCYIGASAKTWREIVGGTLKSVEDGLGRVLRALDYQRARWSKEEIEARTWDFDERYLGALIADWSGFDRRTQKIDRTFVEGEWRLDRGEWGRVPEVVARGTLDGIADAHLPRPGFGEHWPSIRSILALALPAELLAWVDEYRASWVRLGPA